MLGIVAAAVLTLGCAAESPSLPATRPTTTLPATLPATRPAADAEVWNHDIGGHEDDWLTEARKRFKNPYILICHGDSASSGGKRWVLCPELPRLERPTKEEAERLHKAMPDRDIVLISCNECGADLNVPRVWYARRVVWSAPWWAASPKFDPDKSCGNIWEFISCGGAAH